MLGEIQFLWGGGVVIFRFFNLDGGEKQLDTDLPEGWRRVQAVLDCHLWGTLGSPLKGLEWIYVDRSASAELVVP